MDILILSTYDSLELINCLHLQGIDSRTNQAKEKGNDRNQGGKKEDLQVCDKEKQKISSLEGLEEG